MDPVKHEVSQPVLPVPHQAPGATDSGLLQLHLAEYNALTTRVTYWLTLQFTVWPIVIGFWGLLALLWASGKVPEVPLLWGGAFISQAFGLMWSGVTIEIYRAARYVEQDLKHMIEGAIGEGAAFWQYEQRNQEDRGELLPFVWEWPIAVGGLVIVGWVAVRRLPWGAGDYFAFSLNAALALGLVAAAIAGGRIRREITSAAKG